MSIQFAARKQRESNCARASLTKKLIRAKNALHAGDQHAAPIVRNLESDLSSLVFENAEGVKIRSRAQWLEKGEKPTRFFFRLEQKRAEKNSFESLVDTDGVEKSSPADLERILVNFYTALFSKDTIDMQIQTELIDDLELSLNDLEREQAKLYLLRKSFCSLYGACRLARPRVRTGSLPSFISLSGILLATISFAFLMSAFAWVSLRIVSARASYG